MFRFMFLKLSVLVFCYELVAAEIPQEDEGSKSHIKAVSINQDAEEVLILQQIQGVRGEVDKNRVIWTFLNSAYSGNLKTVKFLRSRFDGKMLDEDAMYDALQWASVGGWLPTVEYLMTCEQKAMLTHMSVNDALVNASWKGHLPIVEYFS